MGQTKGGRMSGFELYDDDYDEVTFQWLWD